MNLTNKIIHSDAVTILSQIPDSSVKLILTDPPYFTACKELLPDEIITFDDYLTWYEEWIKEIPRILTDDGSLYVFVPPLEFAEVHMLIKKYFHQRQVITWIKPNVMVRQPTARTYFPKTEFVGFYTKHPDKFTWNRIAKKFGLQNCCNFMIESTIHKRIREGVGHPTQKPLKLCYKYVYASSNEGDIVLDPFCGSGTTLVAAKLLNRKFIGIDVNSKYCRMSRSRVGQFLKDDLKDKPKNVIF